MDAPGGYLRRCLDAGCSTELAALLDAARSHALVALRRRKSPLPPTVLVKREGKTEVHEFQDAPLETAAHRAQEFIKALGGDAAMYVVVLDSYVTIEGTDVRNQDALLIEGAERGKPTGYRLVQRYRPARMLRRLEPLGEFDMRGLCANLLGG